MFDNLLLDIDGVVSDVSHLEKDIDGSPESYDVFYSKIHTANVIEAGVVLYHTLISKTKNLYYVTSRRERSRKQTEKFLYNNLLFGVDKSHLVKQKLIMRQDDDWRDSPSTKKEMIESLKLRGLSLFVDDLDENCEMARSLGIPVLQVRFI
jgi:uncharacterized HAD superfamily protein